MKPRPTIFLSGVSSEFGSFRDAVENEIEKKGCFAENQTGFPPDYRTVEEMLRRKLADSDAVIHIVGFRFGAEPNERPLDVPRRSYTQMEFDIAREMQKPIYRFISTDASVRQPPAPDEKPDYSEAVELQLVHRQAVQSENNLYYFFKDQQELCKLVAEIPPVSSSERIVDISRIIKYAPAELIGRETETRLLENAWTKVRRAETPRPRVLTFVALGGEGKTSLIAKWAADLAHHSWPGCDAVFAWSFYSQGTHEQMSASSDLFLKAALTFFGDPDTANSPAGAFDKGRRLAQLVGERRALLILDGVEPLQYAPTSPMSGQLKDQGLSELLKGLAAGGRGLCVVTTRYSLPDLRSFWETTAPEVKLSRLTRAAGVYLLQTLGVRNESGSQAEFEQLVEDVKGHALTLNLLGTYLRDAHHGDIRRRDRVKLEEADVEEQGGHAFRVMEAYEREFEREGDKGKRALAILRLLGLFDRPATLDCLQAVWQGDAIAGLTESLSGISEPQRNLVLKRLEDDKLIALNRSISSELLSLDSHPLLREYFAKSLLIGKPGAWRAAHARIFAHLCATTKEGEEPTLEELAPLYQAVTHGCQAGLLQAACNDVYYARIQRSGEFYAQNRLSAFGSDLGAVVCFFESPWIHVSPMLTDNGSWLLGQAAFCLRSLGRLTEALEPMRAVVDLDVQQQEWVNASVSASNLSELELTLGKTAESMRDAENSVTYADRSNNAFQQISRRTMHADALHQSGMWKSAVKRFREAKAMQAELQPQFPVLYSLSGFVYCDLLLGLSERAAWRKRLNLEISGHKQVIVEACRAVGRTSSMTIEVAERNHWLLAIALDRLTLSNAALYEMILTEASLEPCRKSIDQAVSGLRRAGAQDHIPRGLLTRAWFRFLTRAETGPDSSNRDLDEAYDIAARGPMKLLLADIHLYRARLFFREPNYPWESPATDLAAAEKLINECGYHRRDEELADAKAAILAK